MLVKPLADTVIMTASSLLANSLGRSETFNSLYWRRHRAAAVGAHWPFPAHHVVSINIHPRVAARARPQPLGLISINLTRACWGVSDDSLEVFVSRASCHLTAGRSRLGIL